PESRIPKPETRNPKPETWIPKPGSRNPDPETRNPQPETRCITAMHLKHRRRGCGGRRGPCAPTPRGTRSCTGCEPLLP
ncbi:hypothetical protein T484DRAFT_1608051, partial [Baffinella frigidus]